MRRMFGSISIHVCVALCILALLVLPLTSAAQSGPDTRATKDHEATGQLSVQIQHLAGTAFFEGASIALFTRDIEVKLSTKSDRVAMRTSPHYPSASTYSKLLRLDIAPFRNKL